MAAEDVKIPPQEGVINEEEVLAKYDREFDYRRLTGPVGKLVFAVAVIFPGQLYTAAFGVFPPTLQRAPHVGIALFLIFLLYPMKRGSRSDTIPWYDYILAALGLVVALYHVIFYRDLLMRAGAFTRLDMIISIIAILLVLRLPPAGRSGHSGPGHLLSVIRLFRTLFSRLFVPPGFFHPAHYHPQLD